MALVILMQYTIVTTSVRNFFSTEHDVFSIAIIDLIFGSALVGFSLLCVSYYYNWTGIVCYVYLVYNIFNYSDCFKLSRDTPAKVYLQLLFVDLQWIHQLRMFCYWSSQNSIFIEKSKPISLWYFVT